MDYRRLALLGGGFLLVLVGAMPLCGYVGCQVWPGEFPPSTFSGSSAHLMIGLIPVLSGIVLIVLGCDRASQILFIAAVGIGMGLVMSVPSFVDASDHKGLLCWLAIVAASLALAVVVRGAVGAGRWVRG